MSKVFTLTAVTVKAEFVLHVQFADGANFDVDLRKIIAKSPSLALLTDPAVFKQAKVGEWGGTVTWGSDELELAADNLRARAIEQKGDFSHESMMNWMRRHKLTQNKAAHALGLSRRMLGYYLSGEKAVPRTVALACIGWTHASHDERFALAA